MANTERYCNTAPYVQKKGKRASQEGVLRTAKQKPTTQEFTVLLGPAAEFCYSSHAVKVKANSSTYYGGTKHYVTASFNI